MRRAAGTGIMAVLALGIAAQAAQAQGEAPVPGLGTATQEIEEAQAALQAEAGPQGLEPSRELTTELRDLTLLLPALEGAERRRVAHLVARPPVGDGDFEPYGGEWDDDAVPAAPVDTEHFRIHYVLNTADAPSLTDTEPGLGNGIPDYIDLVAGRAEQSYHVQNDTLGWPQPIADGTRGGNGKVDIYISQLCGTPNQCVFGYASNGDDSSSRCTSPPWRCHAFLVLDDNYSEFGYSNPDVPLSATMAHEYNHILQFAIDAFQDAWMFESTATWSEELVFPNADDWVKTYMGRARWAGGSRVPITEAGGGGGFRIYGTAVWNHWLTQAHGARTVLRSWQKSRQGRFKDFAVGAYHLGIRSRGGKGFSQEFARFAAATAEWRTGDEGFPDAAQLTDVRRKATLRPGGRPAKLTLDHTAYQLLRVKPGRATKLELRVRAPRRTRIGIALIGRDGTPTGGEVTRRVRYAGTGGRARVRLGGVRRLERVTIAIVNADGRINGYGGGDWRYTRDNRAFRVALRRG